MLLLRRASPPACMPHLKPTNNSAQWQAHQLSVQRLTGDRLRWGRILLNSMSTCSGTGTDVQARLDALPVAEDGLQLGQRLQPLGLRALDQQVQVALVARVPLRRVQPHTGFCFLAVEDVGLEEEGMACTFRPGS